MNRRTRSIRSLLVIGAAASLALAGCVQGPPSAGQVADEFDDVVKPAWSVDVPGIFGQATVSGDLVAVYAQDEKDGMRLEVHDTATGELLWQHVASPGGAWGAPLFSETQSASRPYPIPAIAPFVVTVGKGDKAKPVVVFTERVLTETNEIYNPDILHVADLRTGEDRELTAPGYEEYESPFAAPYVDDDGNLIISPYSPYRVCGDEPTVCLEDGQGGFYRIDVANGEVTQTDPEFDKYDGTTGYQRDYGPEYVQLVGDEVEAAGDTLIAKLDGSGGEAWRLGADDLFGEGRGSAAELRDFELAAGVLLIQGYRSIVQNTDYGTLEYDYEQSRTLAGVDPDTGEVLWTAEGVDALCFAVDRGPRGSKATVIPVCHATKGSFLYDIDEDRMVKEVDPEVSVAGLDVTDGSLTWEVAHAGDQAILEHGRQIDAVFASGTALAVVDTATRAKKGPMIELLDLASGTATPMPEKSSYLCESERDGVKLKFQGSVFTSGSNPIALEYPAGWYQFPCDEKAAPATTWTKGAVRVGGYPAAENRVVVVTEKGLAGFAL